MKLLKQILIFLAFTGAIFGIFTIATRQKPELNTDALAAANHEQIIKEIDGDWSNLSDWDEETYNRQLTKVAQSLNAGVINDVDNRTLRDRINKSAYTKCVDAMEREFGRADCDDAKLTLNYDGLQVVQMNEPGLSSNDRIIEVSKIYNLYKRVFAFNNRSFNMSHGPTIRTGYSVSSTTCSATAVSRALKASTMSRKFTTRAARSLTRARNSTTACNLTHAPISTMKSVNTVSRP